MVGFQHSFTLCGKVRQRGITSLACDLWPPIAQKSPNSILGSRIAFGSWIGNPEVKLKSAIAARAHL